jgi:hypothetical protein
MSDNRKAFTSPDGSIRKVTIHPNGDDSGAQVDSQIVTSTEGNPVDIFAGTPLQADDRLATGAKVDPKKELEQTHTKPPTIKPRTAVYSGPKCAEDARDGCLATT